MFVCHWFMAIAPKPPGALSKWAVVPPASLTGVERPSTSMSFHWSKTVTLQSPSGRPDKVNVPSALHLVNAKSSPSGSPKRSEEHTSELQSQSNLVCRLLLEKKKKQNM